MLEHTWYIIANPTSGNGKVLKKWNTITSYLNICKLSYTFSFTDYHLHEVQLVQDAISKGYKKFISVGGDGTLHHIVNGIMAHKKYDPLHFKIGVIPLGTGNDWVKTYNIPKNIKKAITIIKNEQTVLQDIGLIEVLKLKQKVYFNNLAGLGFDGFVVKNIKKFKKIGRLSYLFGTILSFLSYKKSELVIQFDDQNITTKPLLTLVGICQYSGGGMQLTKNVDTTDGLFDISIAKDFSLFTMIINVLKFYNGTIVNHKKVATYKTSQINIYSTSKEAYIQADGELIGSEGFKATILQKSLQFIVP